MAYEMSASGVATVIARLETDEKTAQAVADTAVDRFGSDHTAVGLTVTGERWRLDIYFRDAPDQEAVRAAVAAAAGARIAAALVFTRVAATDWVRDSLAGLTPVVAGRFIVHGAHDRARVPRNRIGIEIEAALAFGTGHHGSTRGCLLALDRICKATRKPKRVSSPYKGEGWGGGQTRRPPMTPTRLAGARRPPPSRGSKGNLSILDLGTGSGVLAIAAARALHARVLATDIDATAVRAARANARRNRAGALVEIVKADGVTARALRAGGRFDPIFANILLKPLLRLAAPLRRLLAPGGRVVLSGIMPAQANAVIAAYRPLALERRIDRDGWTTLVLTRGISKRRSGRVRLPLARRA